MKTKLRNFGTRVGREDKFHNKKTVLKMGQGWGEKEIIRFLSYK